MNNRINCHDLVKYDEQTLSRIASYIGTHAFSQDYKFQETVRVLDIHFKELIKKEYDEKVAQQFFVNGWGQVLAILYLRHNKMPMSPEFSDEIEKLIQQTINKVKTNSNPFMNINVRGLTKNILMFPHADVYFPFKELNLDHSMHEANALLAQASLKFELYEDKLYLMFEDQDIINKLWNSKFSHELIDNGFMNMQKNDESPHITLINSNVIAQIKEAFIKKYGNSGIQKYNVFFKEVILELNVMLKKEASLIMCDGFNATYSEDYSPFGEVVVAHLSAPAIKRILAVFYQKIEKEVGILMKPKDASSYHLSVAICKRGVIKSSHGFLMEFVKNMGSHAEMLIHFIEKMKARV